MAFAHEARAAFEAGARMDGRTPDSGVAIPLSRHYQSAKPAGFRGEASGPARCSPASA